MVVTPWHCPHGGGPGGGIVPLAGRALGPGDAGGVAAVPARLRAAPAPRPPGVGGDTNTDPHPPPGPVCNRSFDMYVCWGDAPPNSTATVPCPWYLPWHHRVQGGVVARRCGPDGQWVTDGTGRPWRDHSQCEDLEQEQPLQVGAAT
uniref:G-protein coupled receptors family 2 profile 1 domain-containing protein n=1 Tax=Cairina moschata TaxID=8855 RepID=A0A8C3C3I0_CAIMO